MPSASAMRWWPPSPRTVSQAMPGSRHLIQLARAFWSDVTRFERPLTRTTPSDMHYISTRGADHAVTLGEGIVRGIAPDGGLYVPREFPHFTARQFEDDTDLPQIGTRLLTPFAAGDPLAAELPAICREAFDF